MNDRVEASCLNWKHEYEECDMSGEEIDEYRRWLKNLTSDELEEQWFHTVGEWVESRGLDAEEQFEKVKVGDEDFGYVYPVA